MSGLTIDQAIQAEDVTIESVDCPEWGGTVYLRSIRGWQRDQFDQKFAPKPDGTRDVTHCRATLVAMSWCDENGEFANPTPAQITALSDKSSAPLDRCFDVAQRLSGMVASAVEDARKNSSSGPSESSG